MLVSAADDLVQDTIVRAMTAAHQYRAGTNLKAWMFTILRNLHYNEVRKNRLHIQSLDDPLAYEPAVPPSQMGQPGVRRFPPRFLAARRQPT